VYLQNYNNKPEGDASLETQNEHQIGNSDASTREEREHRSDGKILAQHNRFYETTYREAINWLNIDPTSRVLDAGCGGGGITRLLAEKAEAVVALDLAPDLLAYTRQQIQAAKLSERVSYFQADIQALSPDLGQFDLIWCNRVVHGLPDPLKALQEMRQLLKPGGRLVLGEGGFALRFLPNDLGFGEPGIEYRLQATRQKWFAAWRSSLPDVKLYGMGWLGLLAEAGFGKASAKTFLLEKLPPFEPDESEYLVSGLQDYLENPKFRDLQSASDLETLKKLTEPASPDYVLKRPDLHALAGISLYIGS
jgi:SAM-dependent methyltransferase